MGGKSAISHLEIDGSALEYRWSGPPNDAAPAIVLLHEGLGSLALWKDFPEKLAAATGCAVLAYSRRGHGRSAPLGEPRGLDYLHREAALLPALLDALGANGPLFLFGHSDGASIALLHSARQRPPPAGLILETPHVFVEDVTLAGIARSVELFESTDLGARLGRYHDDADRLFRAWADTWLSPAFRSWNIESVLPAVRTPVLLIQCEGDPYGTRAQLDAIARRVRSPSEILLLPGDSHVPHTAHAERVLASAARFIARVQAGPSSPLTG